MNQAIIDIGSNSMRLTVYHVEGREFEILFKQKAMSGLAGYVENGRLTDEGIEVAVAGLIGFRDTLRSLRFSNYSVFATASLRNIENSREATETISARTGMQIEILSGEEEANLGYLGAMQEFQLTEGIFVDIGGASTEIVTFQKGNIRTADSYQIGSLKLYRDCVEKILPEHDEVKDLKKQIGHAMNKSAFDEKKDDVIFVGGTARAVLKISQRVCGISAGERVIDRKQFGEVYTALSAAPRQVADLILKTEPERIHTMIPGFMIMKHIVEKSDVRAIYVGRYGVREGYLCEKIWK